MIVLGKAYFDPDNRGAYVEVLLARNSEELLLHWEGDEGVAEIAETEPRAYTMSLAYKKGQRKYGHMAFNWLDCEIPIIVHECVHAAENYAGIYLQSTEYKKQRGGVKREIRCELMPCLVENLVSQTWVLISNEKNTKL